MVLHNTGGGAAQSSILLTEPFAKLLVGLRQAWLTAYIYCFNQLGTAQAEACGYILQKAQLITDH
jgi:hypothetical protein